MTHVVLKEVRELIRSILVESEDFDLDSVKYDRKKFGNLDYVLILLTREGPKLRGQIISRVREWRALNGDPDVSIELASMFKGPPYAAFGVENPAPGVSGNGYFQLEKRGPIKLTDAGHDRAVIAMSKAHKMLSLGSYNSEEITERYRKLLEKMMQDPREFLPRLYPPSPEPVPDPEFIRRKPVREILGKQLDLSRCTSFRITNCRAVAVDVKMDFDGGFIEDAVLHPAKVSLGKLMELAEAQLGGARTLRRLEDKLGHVLSSIVLIRVNDISLAHQFREQCISLGFGDPLEDPRLDRKP